MHSFECPDIRPYLVVMIRLRFSRTLLFTGGFQNETERNHRSETKTRAYYYLYELYNINLSTPIIMLCTSVCEVDATTTYDLFVIVLIL